MPTKCLKNTNFYILLNIMKFKHYIRFNTITPYNEIKNKIEYFLFSRNVFFCLLLDINYKIFFNILIFHSLMKKLINNIP